MSMFGTACGTPETTETESSAVDMQQSGDALQQAKTVMGLGADHNLVARASVRDEQNLTHVGYGHTCRGVRVFQGDTVVHTNGTATTVTGLAHRDITINTIPKLAAADARAAAHAALKPQGPYASEPSAELVIVPNVEQQLIANPMRGPTVSAPPRTSSRS